MAFIPTPNSVQLCFDFATAGQNWQFCLTLRKATGAPTVPDLSTLTGVGASWWTATLAPQISSNTTLRQVRATNLTTQTGPQNIQSVGTPGTGASTSTQMGTALVISLRTAKRGRSYRGRLYLAGMPTNTILNATDTTSGYATAIASAFTTLSTSISLANYIWVVASKQHDGIVTNPAETNDVTGLVVDAHYDSQRRRLYGRGS
jgi:hypothetical protein